MSSVPAYKNETLCFEERVEDLVSRMSVEEKASQLIYNAPAIPRLDISSYNWWNEALHGVARAGTATVFPQAIGLAATFDENLVFQVADIISTEARAKFNEFQRKGDYGIYKGLTFWSPNVNIFRDPRWGRGHETYGEDPYLSGRLGVSFIRGLQGNNGKYLKTAACAKHFAVHSGPESGRHEFNAVVSKKDLYETYLYAFKECVKSGLVEAVMGAYNRVNGEPCCGSIALLDKILRSEWGFKGHVVSDCGAICDFHKHHMITKTIPESVALALNNGCDLNCGTMYVHLLISLKEGLITEEAINRSVYRLMMTRMKLGMFDKPSKVEYTDIRFEVNDCREHRKAALEASRRTLVLLKNRNNLLPLDKNKLKSVAVIGPNADSIDALRGNYHGTSSRYVTVLQGITEYLGDNCRVFFSQGCHLYKSKVENTAEERDRFSEAISVAEQSDAVIMCLGLDASIEGEDGDASNEYAAGDRMDLNLPGLQQELLETVCKTGKPVILILLAGSSLTIKWAAENIPAIVQAWYPGEEGGRAIAELLFGEFSPSGKLPVTFYESTEELPDFSDYSMKNRTYRYMKTSALYPFGYGLTYTKFEYSDIRLNTTRIKAGETLQCRVTVANAGNFPSWEVVQLYIKDIEASVPIPIWQLRGISNIFLAPGEKKEVCFHITPRMMALIDNNGRCLLEPGSFNIYIGGMQPDKRSRELTGADILCGRYDVTGNTLELEY